MADCKKCELLQIELNEVCNEIYEVEMVTVHLANDGDPIQVKACLVQIGKTLRRIEEYLRLSLTLEKP